MDADQFELDARTIFAMWIDRYDQITGWKSNSQFADSDHVAVNAENTFVGTNLFDYVLGHFTRQFLRKFLNAARETSEQRRMLYRCDSPSHKQLMEMHACSSPAGDLRISHNLVESKPFEFEVNFDAATKSQKGRVLRCSICNRLRRRGTNDWREAESIAEPDSVMLVIHTVCPDCRSGIKVKSILINANR